MKYLIFLFCTFFVLSQLKAQKVDSSSVSMIPVDAKNSTFYIAKYQVINSTEAEILLADSWKSKQGKAIENLELYNLIFQRKMNNEIQKIFDKFELSNVTTMNARDISENLNDSIRFVITPVFEISDLLLEHKYISRYYIYDQIENIRYKSFADLETLLTLIKNFNWYSTNRFTDKTTQQNIDKYIDQNLPNERTKIEVGRGPKIFFGIATYAFFQWGIIKLANL